MIDIFLYAQPQFVGPNDIRLCDPRYLCPAGPVTNKVIQLLTLWAMTGE